MKELEQNPHTFHHLTKVHLKGNQLAEEDDKHMFDSARAYLLQMEKKGLLKRVEEPSFFVYRQVNLKNGDQFNGLIALCDAEEYEQGSIKKHENIQTARVSYLGKLLRETEVMGEPVLLTHPTNQELDDLYRELAHTNRPILRFISADRRQHEIWQISDEDILRVIADEFKEIEALYIADGHHRSHIASTYWQEQKTDLRRFFLGLIVPENQLQITSFHRLWKQKEQLDEGRFWNLLEKDFDIIALDAKTYLPGNPRLFGLYINNKWFELSPKHYVGEGTYERLDVVILEELLFKNIFDVRDSRSDQRIIYFSGDQSLQKLMDMVDQQECQFAVTVYPPDFSQVRAIADEGLSMPPKSTYVEPKLRSGMIVQKYDENNF